MKIFNTTLISTLLLFSISALAQNNTGIGTTTPNPNAILELDNNGSPLGLLLPRQDISTFTLGLADSGMMVYNTVDDKIYIWNGSAWVSATSEWGVNGTDIFNLNTGNVGIGINTPAYKLTVVENIAGSIAGLNSSGSNTLMDFNNAGVNPANWTFGYLGNTGGNPGFMTFLRGSHRFVITNNGDVGIAETDPQARLEINSSGNSSASFGLLMSNSSLNPTLSVRDDGHVGIGTSVPDATLTVIDNQQLNLQIQSSSTVGTWLSMNNSSVGGEWFHVINTGSANGEGVGKLLLQRGANGGTASGLFMAMDHASLNIGINHSNPLEKLHLYDPSDPTIRLTSSTSTAFSNAANSGTIQLLEANSDPGVSAFGGGLTYDGSSNLLKLQTYNGATSIDALSISRGSGFVGIATTAPTRNLHVEGTGLISGRLELTATTDASGAAGSGVLEIANGVRIDGNEIITNTNATLFLQNDNSGDLAIDASTFYVESAGNRVGIGTTAPSTQSKLHVASGDVAVDGSTGAFGIKWVTGNTLLAHMHRFGAVDNNLYVTNAGNSNLTGVFLGSGATFWTSTSDKRLKENIVESTYGLNEILQLSPKEYNFITSENSKKQIGFLAQDVYQIIPEIVNKGDDGEFRGEGNAKLSSELGFNPWGINYTELIPVLVKAIQELKAENEELRELIEAIDSK
ncbi:tail fiber domain-containing protein [Hyphobacterium sp. CCMP332]|nr:tail fiber domain-containing protein [Hyphobacterium sp. CCMP332]